MLVKPPRNGLTSYWFYFSIVASPVSCIYKRGGGEGRRLPPGSPSVQDRKPGALLMSDRPSTAELPLSLFSFYLERESWWVFQACLELTQLSLSPSQSWDYKPADLTLYSKKWWRGGWNFPLRVEKQNPWGMSGHETGDFCLCCSVECTRSPGDHQHHKLQASRPLWKIWVALSHLPLCLSGCLSAFLLVLVWYCFFPFFFFVLDFETVPHSVAQTLALSSSVSVRILHLSSLPSYNLNVPSLLPHTLLWMSPGYNQRTDCKKAQVLPLNLPIIGT